MEQKKCEHKHYRVAEAHPYQRLEEADDPDTFNVTEQGETLECKCDDCGAIFYA